MMSLLRLAAVGICALLVAACSSGGGGGGGGNSPGNPLQVSLDKTSLTFDVFHNTPGTAQTVIATATGEYSGTLYIGAIIEGQGIDPTIPVSISGTRGQITISADESLAPGQYTGRVLALLCSDAQCTNRIGGTPLPITYSVNVRSSIVVGTAARMYLSATAGSSVTSAPISVTPAATFDSFTATPAADSPWLQVTDLTSTSFRVIAGPRAQGRVTGTINVSSGPTSAPLLVDFTSVYPAGNSAGLYASPKTLTFNLMPGMQASRNVSVSHSGATSAAVSHASPASGSWLRVTGSGPYGVNVSSDGLALGTYSAVVHIQSGAQANAVDMVDVVLNVGPTLTAAPVEIFNIDSISAVADLDGSSAIGQLGGAENNWTATTDTPWLTLTRASGAAGTAVEFSIPQAQLSALDNFDTHIGNIHVTGGPDVQAVDVPVVLNKQIAQIVGLGPQIQVSGRALQTIVRGKGLLAAGESRIRIAGAAIDDLTIVDDTTAVLETPALFAGSYEVSVHNELGFAMPAQALQVISPVSHTYAVVPTADPVPHNGWVRSLFIDPLRATAYAIKALNVDEMYRFRFDGSAWQKDTIAEPGLANANLSNDGSRLLITTAAGRLSYRDPVTLAEQEHFEIAAGIRGLTYIFGKQGPLTISNDNQVWLATVRSGFDQNYLTRFDPATGQFTHAPDDASRIYTRTPRFAVSRDGQRLVLDTTLTGGITNPVFTLTAAPGFAPAATSLTHNCFGVLSEHGERAACGRLVYETDMRRYLESEIFDSNMQSLGKLTIDATARSVGWRIIGPVLFSPDGRLAYAYSINQNDFRWMPLATEAPTSTRPRVYVFDVSSNTPTAEIGSSEYFEFDTVTYPGCRLFESSDCEADVKGTIAVDGQTLYFIGDQNFVVLPIPVIYR